MSRSWTDFLRFNSRKAAGLYLGRTGMCAVVMARGKSGWEELSARTAVLAGPLFEGDPTPAIASGLAQALRAVGTDFIGGFVPLRVMLPDSAVRYATFELDAIPPREKVRQELLRWRFSRDMQRIEDSIACVGQPIGAHRGKRLLFSQAMDRNWVDCLRGAFKEAGLTPWVLNAAAAYRHNLHYESFAPTGGVLVTIDPDSWGFQLWDAEKRLRYVRSRWRVPAMDYELIADEVEHGVRAHSQIADGYRIERLYIAGVPEEVQELRQALDRRLHQSISCLEASALGGATMDKQHEGARLLARTAAMGYEDHN